MSNNYELLFKSLQEFCDSYIAFSEEDNMFYNTIDPSMRARNIENILEDVYGRLEELIRSYGIQLNHWNKDRVLESVRIYLLTKEELYFD